MTTTKRVYCQSDKKTSSGGGSEDNALVRWIDARVTYPSQK
jgi:hypothetical protein